MINLLFNTGKKFPIAFVCNNTIKVGDVVKINEKPYYITCVPGTVTPSGNISKFYYCVNASVTFQVTNTVKYISKRQREYEQLIRDKIAWDVDDKMLYLDTCPNERDIILSIISPETYEQIQETHCNSDCSHRECMSYNFNRNKLREVIHLNIKENGDIISGNCPNCKHWLVFNNVSNDKRQYCWNCGQYVAFFELDEVKE